MWTFFRRPVTENLRSFPQSGNGKSEEFSAKCAARWRGHLRPLAATCGHSSGHSLGSLAATCGHSSVGAFCGHLRPLAATCGHLRPLENQILGNLRAQCNIWKFIIQSCSSHHQPGDVHGSFHGFHMSPLSQVTSRRAAEPRSMA